MQNLNNPSFENLKYLVVHTAERAAANAYGHLRDLVLNHGFLLLERQRSSMAERTTLYLAMFSVFHGAIRETDTYG
jgi:hypothetical protein